MISVILAALLAVADGEKSLTMFKNLNASELIDYNPATESIVYEGTSYRVLRGSISDFSIAPVACLGEYPLDREMILLDPSNSPLLDMKYRDFIKVHSKNPLQALIPFIRTEVFNVNFCDRLDPLIKKWKSTIKTNRGDRVPVIPIDAFIYSKVGVCRHFALVSAYFLDRLIREEVLPAGQSYYVRGPLDRGGGHAWTLYATENEAWHIDPLWDVIKNLNRADDVHYLWRFYGKKAINTEIIRFIN